MIRPRGRIDGRAGALSAIDRPWGAGLVATGRGRFSILDSLDHDVLGRGSVTDDPAGRATCANGSRSEAAGFGVDIAEVASRITGLATMFGAGVTGASVPSDGSPEFPIWLGWRPATPRWPPTTSGAS
jgi:hypothetical protein